MTEIIIVYVNYKIQYQSKDYVPEIATDSKKKKPPVKEEKKDDKKSKIKKQNLSSLLESYNLISSEDKTVAAFELELAGFLDGSTKQIQRNFMHKHIAEQKVEEVVQSKDSDKRRKSLQEKRKSADIMKGKVKGPDVKKPEPEESVELAALELDLKFKVLNFSDFKQLKEHFEDDE